MILCSERQLLSTYFSFDETDLDFIPEDDRRAINFCSPGPHRLLFACFLSVNSTCTSVMDTEKLFVFRGLDQECNSLRLGRVIM